LRTEEGTGVLAGAAAYGLWGLFPLWFHLLDPAGAPEILANRIVWTFVVMGALTTFRHDWARVRGLRSEPRTIGLLVLAAVLISTNWGVYVWAVTVDRVVEASLGYFICPLLTVVVGVSVLHERLRRLQRVAVALGAAAVAVLAVAYGRLPWVALALAATFTAYGFIKKRVDLPAATSLMVETAVVAPVALAAMVAMSGSSAVTDGGARLQVLLVGTGVVTAVPLVLFAASAKRVPLTVLGLLQYITPVLQFLLGVLVFAETMSGAQWWGFTLVWVALVLLSVDAVSSQPRRRPAATPG